jgi:monoamine oxidase
LGVVVRGLAVALYCVLATYRNFAIPSILLFPSLASCEKEIITITTDKKVAVIGAGIAGLAAAKYFKDRGVEVVVIEAQGKVGGRLCTDRSLGIAFDEGASWIHGPNRNPITPLADLAGVTERTLIF